MFIAPVVVLRDRPDHHRRFVSVVVGRRRWLKRRPGRSSPRPPDGRSARQHPTELETQSARRVRDVLVFSKTTFTFRIQLVPVDRTDATAYASTLTLSRVVTTHDGLADLAGSDDGR